MKKDRTKEREGRIIITGAIELKKKLKKYADEHSIPISSAAKFIIAEKLMEKIISVRDLNQAKEILRQTK